MKKLISVIITAALIFSLFTVPSFGFSDIEESEYKSDINELKLLGIMEGDEQGNFNPFDAVTRAEFAKIISTIDMEGIEIVSGGNSSFRDLDDSHWGFPYIFYVASRGYMRGYDDRTFRPDESITGYEVVKVLMALSGYEYRAVPLGGYPVGYEAAARSLGMLKGITVDLNEYLYRDEIAKIINNALDLNYVELVGVGENLEYKIHNDKTLLSEKLGVKRGEGRVLATDAAALGINDLAGENMINIDGKLFTVEDENARNLLGYNVRYMYRFDKEDEENNTLIYIEDDETEVLTVNREDFLSVSGGVLTYEDVDRSREIRVSQNADYILNGDRVGFSHELFEEMKMGEITLISAKGKNEYDVVILTSWKVMVVDITDSGNKILRDKFDPAYRFNLDEESGKNKKIYKDGKAIEFSAISVGDIITAAIGDVNSVYHVTHSAERGIIESYDEETITVNGKSIKRNYYFEESGLSIETGKNVTLYFDYFGNVATYSVGITEGESLAYLVKLKGKESVADSTVFAKLFFTDGSLGTYTFADNLYVNGEMIKNVNEAKLLSLLENEKGEYAQLLKVKLEEGLIKGITIALTEEELEAKGQDGFCLMYEEKPRNCQTEANCYSYDLYVDENTIYMHIPPEAETAEAREFKILDSKSYMEQGKEYILSGYTESKEDVIASVVVPKVGSAAANAVWETHETVAVISTVSNVVNEDGEQLLKFHVFKGRFGDSRMEADVFVSLDDADLYDLDKEKKYTPRDLEAGDIIVLKRSSDDYIELFQVVRKYSDGIYKNPNVSNVNYIYEREVYDVKGNYVFTVDADGTKATYEIRNNTYVIFVSEVNGIVKVRNGSVSEIVPEDKGIFQITSRIPFTVVVFK